MPLAMAIAAVTKVSRGRRKAWPSSEPFLGCLFDIPTFDAGNLGMAYQCLSNIGSSSYSRKHVQYKSHVIAWFGFVWHQVLTGLGQAALVPSIAASAETRTRRSQRANSAVMG